MSEYTPGPWFVAGLDENLGREVRNDEWIITSVNDFGPSHDAEQRANARLIAAAPNLLLALKNLTAQIELDNPNTRKDYSLLNAHAWATKAIRKAEGRHE